MSDLHCALSSRLSTGIVDHSQSLAKDIGKIYITNDFSDVTLVVSGHKFHVHKAILAARSKYFCALMFGGMQESQQNEIEIKGADVTAFKSLLKYIYLGYLMLKKEKEETIIEILSLAHQYGFEELETAICDYLKETLTVENFCTIYDISILYCLSDMKSLCQDFLDKNAQAIINEPNFKVLSEPALKSIVGRDSFCAPEIDIFTAIKEWVETNTHVEQQTRDDIIALIRLPLISLLDMLNIVRPSNLISPDTLLDAIKAKNESRDTDLPYRGYLVPEENVATPDKDAVVLTGEMETNLLDGNTTNYDIDRGFTRHFIDDSPRHILVRLGRPCILNHFRLVLWDKDPRSYSYYIEVSMDEKDWIRVVDHTRYCCRSWQYLYFPSRPIRYIKIVGTNNTVNRVFHVVALEAYYTKQEPTLHQGIVAPRSNVALVSRSAVVIEGVSRIRNNLLNGEFSQYDWDSGYTCHQLGSGSICVQLGQPYWLSSLRLLLWDCDNRSYSYFIQSSTNGKDWDLVCDKTRNNCQSWQLIRFSPRTVNFFKIIGVFNTANEVFHCVHFESPASTVDDSSTEEEITEESTKPSGDSEDPPQSSDEPDDHEQRSQFEIMAESNRSPAFDRGRSSGSQDVNDGANSNNSASSVSSNFSRENSEEKYAFNLEDMNPERGGACATNPERGGACAMNPERGGACAMNPDRSGASAMNPERSGACAINPERSGACAMNPDRGGAISMNPERGGACALHPERGGTSAMNPDRGGAISMNPERGGAISMNPERSGATATMSERYEACAMPLNRAKSQSDCNSQLGNIHLFNPIPSFYNNRQICPSNLLYSPHHSSSSSVDGRYGSSQSSRNDGESLSTSVPDNSRPVQYVLPDRRGTDSENASPDKTPDGSSSNEKP